MNKHLYDENGYVNIRYIMEDLGAPYTFIVSARGTGKTFSALKYAVEYDHKFMFMRRTQSAADLISKPAFSPFKALNMKLGWNITVKSLSKYNAAFYRQYADHETGEIDQESEAIGYTCALSTISKMRGFDASDIDMIIYDEFIPEAHEAAIRGEGEALRNAYETINRNRELDGFKPVQMLCLANSNRLDNPIFMDFGLVERVIRMYATHEDTFLDRESGLCVILLQDSPISEKKQETALYKLTGRNSSYYQMAIENRFAGEDTSLVQPQNLIEFTPVVTVGEITIYKHKHRSREYYCSTHHSGAPRDVMGSSEIDIKKFQRKYVHLISAYYQRRMLFESYTAQLLLETYLKIR